MAKLYYRYGAMGASKTANALMVAYNYEEKDMHPLVMKPAIENRDGASIIKSRIGLQRECKLVEDMLLEDPGKTEKENFEEIKKRISPYDVIIVDECQFMTKQQVKLLWLLKEELQIPVICYGLKTDFTNVLFPAAAALMRYADKIEEIKTICWCGDGAKCNARLDKDGNVVTKGEQIQMGGTEDGLPSYTALCDKHYIEKDIGPKMRAKFQEAKKQLQPKFDIPKTESKEEIKEEPKEEIKVYPSQNYYIAVFIEKLSNAYNLMYQKLLQKYNELELSKLNNLYLKQYKELYTDKLSKSEIEMNDKNNKWEEHFKAFLSVCPDLDTFKEKTTPYNLKTIYKDFETYKNILISTWLENLYVDSFSDILFGDLGIKDFQLLQKEEYDIETIAGCCFYYHRSEAAKELEEGIKSGNYHLDKEKYNQAFSLIKAVLEKEKRQEREQGMER